MSQPKRTVTYDGTAYKVKSDKVEIPDFEQLGRMGTLVWLNRHTYRRGPRPTDAVDLRGLGSAINVVVK